MTRPNLNYITTAQAARRVGVSTQTIRAWIHSGILTAYKIRTRWRIDVDHLDQKIIGLDENA